MARTVCQSFDFGDSSTAYVSGLLHDIGSVVIYQYFNEEWVLINRLVQEKHLPMVQAEQEILSMDHAVVGALLLEKWGLPGSIVEVVRLHHSSDEITDNDTVCAVRLADSLAKAIDFRNDLSDFGLFFDKQREVLHAEMPEKYLMNHHVRLFEQAYGNIKGMTEFFMKAAGENDD
jgi:putative nucleotidyltransferase with HDIG domain